jgi:hypothetical protein
VSGEGASLPAWDPARGCEAVAQAAIAAERSAAVDHVRGKAAFARAGAARHRLPSGDTETLVRILDELADELASGFHRKDDE